jgi:hypothetical protein
LFRLSMDHARPTGLCLALLFGQVFSQGTCLSPTELTKF